MNPVVSVDSGRVRGVDNGRHQSFYGIPYAADPIGPRRFRPAVPVGPWSGERDASRRGPINPQRLDDIDRLLGAEEDIPVSEAKSLHLTVHTPSLDGRLPVFVWIHGGSYTSGSSSWRIYDPAHFARDGVVAVSINYRLGALGFLDLRHHFDGYDEPNVALTDAVLALDWIRRNIAAFGGDPDTVTIAGESAGAGMVTALMASPLAHGLFQRVIPQSGMNFHLQEPEQSTRIAANFLEAVGVKPGDRAALETLPLERILDASADRPRLLAGAEQLHLAWNMHRDPRSFPTAIHDVLAAGGTAHLDMLIGTTADENKLMWVFEEPSGIDEGLPDLDSALAERLRTVYRAAGRAAVDWEITEAIGNDRSYLVPSMLAAEEHVRHGGRAFVYLFTWRTPVLDGRLGSCHALENAFVFDRLETPSFHGDAPPQRLAEAIHGAWLEFARSGTPSSPHLPDWPAYDLEREPVMELGEQCSVLSGPRAAEREAWRGFPRAKLGVG